MDLKKTLKANARITKAVEDANHWRMRLPEDVEILWGEVMAGIYAREKFEVAKEARNQGEGKWVPLEGPNGEMCSVCFLDEEDRFAMFDEDYSEEGAFSWVIRDMKNMEAVLARCGSDHRLELEAMWNGEWGEKVRHRWDKLLADNDN